MTSNHHTVGYLDHSLKECQNIITDPHYGGFAQQADDKSGEVMSKIDAVLGVARAGRIHDAVLRALNLRLTLLGKNHPAVPTTFSVDPYEVTINWQNRKDDAVAVTVVTNNGTLATIFSTLPWVCDVEKPVLQAAYDQTVTTFYRRLPK